MTERSPTLTVTAEELRRVFDESFARPAEAAAEGVEDFLAIRVGGERYALPVKQLASVEGRRRIVPLPSPDPALLGIAGSQGRLVPVYRLASLVGAGAAVEEELSWLAVCGQDEPIGLAFASLERHLRVPAGARYEPADDARQYVREALRLASEVRYVLDVPTILAAIRDRAGGAALKRR